MEALILAVLILSALSALSYFILLTLNNIVWGYKGILIDKGAPEYRKRKRMLIFVSIALSIIIIVTIGSLK
jgi:succinate dehydrogenase/fumarate reductase cytochrome b subunit